MMLYGSSPDVLASQQFGYDRFYNEANQANRAAYDAVQARAMQAMLFQRQMEYGARGGELNRQSHLMDIIANRTGNADQEQERIFTEASRLANWLPNDPQELQRFYPTLSPERIMRLSAIVGSAKADLGQQTSERNFQRFYVAAQNADKSGMPMTEDEIPSFGIKPEDPNYQSALAVVKAIQQPYTEEYQKSASLAEVGNRLNRLKKSQGDIEANKATFGWPFILPEQIAKPNPEALTRLADTTKNLAPLITPNLKTSQVSVDASGRLISIVTPRSWMPQTAPVITPSTPMATSGQVDRLRALANAAIQNGKDPQTVRQRFKQLTGYDL